MRKPFDGFGFRVSRKELVLEDFGGWETRNESCIKLIKSAVDQSDITSSSWIYVNTGDRPVNFFWAGYPTLNFSTVTESFSLSCPDFVFDHWSTTGLSDYEVARREISSISTSPSTNRLGWRGAETALIRRQLVANFKSENFDFELVRWDRSDPNNLKASNFLSIAEQISRWRFLIDIEGTGYSGRLKLFLHSNRAIFIQDRPWKEYFFEKLHPWEHYVPVRRDLSDLIENLEKISSSPHMEQHIVNNARIFAQTYLKRDSAIERWISLIKKFGSVGITSRNAECPCGSGLRFIHCHGPSS